MFVLIESTEDKGIFSRSQPDIDVISVLLYNVQRMQLLV